MKKLDEIALTGDQRRETMRELHAVTREMIAGALTPDQQRKLAAMHAKGPRGRHNGQAGGPPPPPSAGSE